MTDNQKNINEGAVSYPELLSVSPSPHIKNPDTTQSIMLRVIIALLPACMWGVYSFGLRAAEILVICVASSVLFEWLFQKIMKRKNTVADFSAALTGLLIGMNLPAAAPLWLGVAGSLFAIVVVKGLFGGIGKNIVNPALAARVFMFAWPAEMGLFTKAGERINDLSVTFTGADAIAGATPLASLDAGVLPEDVTLFDMILGNTGGCIGEVSSVLLILGGIYLLFTKVITWHIPVAFIGTVAVLTFAFPIGTVSVTDFMLSSIFSGGLMLGAIFMATDYVTSPVTAKGQLIYGIGCGLITVFIRYFGGYLEGVSFAILIMNLLSGYIDKVTMPKRFGGGKS
ncbi:MAG: RnfABCDGE type electron transport complex subunit D [Ruminococcaceae bacterium]|nr:RnfABCDGE type electron transport complex subunit D [Oscillospiraceae bacterium]